MNNTEKLSKIVGRDFTYVQVWMADEDGEYAGAKSIVVLTKSKPLARKAVEAVIAQEGWNVRVPHGNKRSYSLYPNNYIVAAKSMLLERPENVYSVEVDTSVSVA